jgi:uncharacterized coiled-coil protein SlyX
MKSLAHQSVEEMGGRGSVLSRQKRDHVKLDRLLGRMGAAPPAEQNAILLQIYRLVFPHAYAEETVLWPVIRRVLADGHELTLQVELEHQEINELATRLEALEHGSAERDRVLERLVELLQEDVRDEEDKLLPALQMKLGVSELRRLGLAWEAVRAMSPTRPHAIVSRRPPGNVLAALPLTILDHCRDVVDSLIHRRRRPASSTLQGLSATLARASHAVERLPGLQRGEDPSTRRGRTARPPWAAAAIVTVVAASAAMVLARRRRGGRSRNGAAI